MRMWLNDIHQRKYHHAACVVNRHHIRGFTLLELLVVIAIIAIIAAFLIFILNPGETLRKARDSQRMNDLATVNKALGLYIVSSPSADLDGDGTRGACGINVFVGRNPGSATVTDATIAEKTLKTTSPTGDSSNTAVDGTGWVPVSLASLLSGSPIGGWPLDPRYSVEDPASVTDNDYLYLYGCDIDLTWELNANLESTTFSSGGSDDRESRDGGNNTNILEVGTKLTILGTSEVGGGGGQYLVFVSSTSSGVNGGNLGGLTGADNTCQNLANTAGLGGVIVWKAWLSTSVASASARLVHQASPIYLVDRTTQVADDWTDLTDGTLDSVINKRENGVALAFNSVVWTGTNIDGTSASATCSDWTSSSIAITGRAGGSSFPDFQWTAASDFSCTAGSRLYCFSQSPVPL